MALDEGQLEDQYFSIGETKNFKFFNVANYREMEDDREDAYFKFYIRMDKKFKIQERKIYSVLDLIGDIGGLVEAVHVFGFLLVGFFASKKFQASLIKKVYQQKVLTKSRARTSIIR